MTTTGWRSSRTSQPRGCPQPRQRHAFPSAVEEVPRSPPETPAGRPYSDRARVWAKIVGPDSVLSVDLEASSPWKLKQRYFSKLAPLNHVACDPGWASSNVMPFMTPSELNLPS